MLLAEKGLDDYMADPLRGKAMSAGLFREMLNGMMFTGKLSNQRKMDKDMPILIVSGEDVSVGVGIQVIGSGFSHP